ncbi:MAG: DUF4321 domain-containing protein [Negativicutes bacterium]|nr:DUF4321 domain-containing protein [Negativicutes bacterium]
MKGGRTKSFGTLALFLITGAIFGGILGELIAGSSALGGLAPYLAKSYSIVDIPPVTINLYVIKLVVGFALHPNLISLLGVVLAFFLFRMF